MLNDYFKQTSLGKVADEYRLHLQMAALETHIRNDTDLHEARASADQRTHRSRKTAPAQGLLQTLLSRN